jgi:alkylmercury lyase-like protein
MLEPADRTLRHWIYGRIVRTGLVPSIDDIADERTLSSDAVVASLRRLYAVHALAPVPESGEIWMAHPFSSTGTPYRVNTPGPSYWANCAWDALAIPAMLQVDATVDARCPDCAEPIRLEFTAGELRAADGVVHFAVAPKAFWRNVGFT